MSKEGRIVSLTEVSKRLEDMWLGELYLKGRAFPSYKDGLKEATRAIVTELARRSDFSHKAIPATTIIRAIGSYKEVGDRNVEKNLFRLAHTNTPLIDIVSNNTGKLQGINRINGNNPAPRYVSLALSPLGVYVMQYRNYFKSIQSDTDASNYKYKDILTPFPLSLVMPQVNLADGVSNDAPNINFHELGNAYIEHLMNDKQSSLEQLTKHITGLESNPGSVVLMTNQALRDLIERGVSKVTILAPVEFTKGEILIKELPFKSFGQTLMNKLEELKQMGIRGEPRGFKSFYINSILPEKSGESIITVGYKLNRGYTIDDVRQEIYHKTDLKKVVVYENIAMDYDKDKPLAIKSVREVLDYHVDLGYELKQAQIQTEIDALKEQRAEAETLEKITKYIPSEITSHLVNKENRRRTSKKHLNEIHAIMMYYMLEKGEPIALTENPLIDKLLPTFIEYINKFAKEKFGDTSKESIELAIIEEVPESFTDEEIQIVWDKKKGVLYDLNKRQKAIDFLDEFKAKLDSLENKLNDKEFQRNSLITEIKKLMSQYPNKRYSRTLYALKAQEREERKRVKEEISFSLSKMETEVLPVNVLIDKDFNAKLSFSKRSNMSGVTTVIEATTNDNLVVFNRKGNSYKVPVKNLWLTPTALGSKENIAFVGIDAPNTDIRMMHVYVTNKGRIGLADEICMYFNNKNLNLSLDADEHVVYYNAVPLTAYSEMYALVVYTKDRKFKRILMTDLSIKSTLSGTYRLFAGPSATNDIIGAYVTTRNNNVFNFYSPEYGISDVSRLQGGYKRNVSMPDDLPFNCDYVIVNDKIPTFNGEVVPDLSIVDKDIYHKLSNLVIEEDNSKVLSAIDNFDLKKVELVNFIRTITRRQFKMPFSPDESQLGYLLSLYTYKEEE